MTEAGGVADDEGGSFFGELFLNQVYRVEERTWTHPETNVARTLRMHVSGAACTDYDLTGAGCGLAGLLFAACGGSVAVTDYNPVVLKLLQRNVEENDEAVGGRARCRELLWGNADHEAALLEESPGGGGYDLLLGADIIYPGSQAYLPGLMHSLGVLLSRRPGAKLLLSYVSRAATTDKALFSALEENDFGWTEVPGTRAVAGLVEGAVYDVRRR